MACGEIHGLKALRFYQISCKTIYISPFPTLSALGPSRIWGAILMQQAQIRIVQEGFMTKTEHKKELLCIFRKNSDGSVIFCTLFLKASKEFLCLWEP